MYVSDGAYGNCKCWKLKTTTAIHQADSRAPQPSTFWCMFAGFHIELETPAVGTALVSL